MTVYNIITFSVAMFLFAMTPGPGVMATLSKALASGFRQTIPLIAGIITGDIIFLLLAVYGLASIADIMADFFVLVRMLGGIYLIWMGIKLWRTRPVAFELLSQVESATGQSFFAGLAITLSNPKVILFYLGFLPTFMDLTSLSNLDIGLSVLIVAFTLAYVMAFYAFSADRAKKMLKQEKNQQKLNKTAGVLMMGVGCFLLLRK